MKHLRRTVGLIVAALILALALAPSAALRSHAQDPNTVSVDGSRIVSPILRTASQLYAAKNPATKIDISVSGTAGGFEKLCAGTLDVNMAVRPITDAETAACQARGIRFVETLLGYNALTVVVHTSSKATCLPVDGLDKLLSPSAAGVKNWQAIDPAIGDAPISGVFAPADPTLTVSATPAATAPATPAATPAVETPVSGARVLADTVVAGTGLRSDLQSTTTAAEIADKIEKDANAVGIMTLAEADGIYGKPIRKLQLRSGTTCIDPSAANLDEARYSAAETLYLYVNVASLDRKPVADFLTFTLGQDGRRAISDNNFTLASETVYDRGLNYLSSKRAGRTFSRIQSVNVPADTVGAINVAGSASVYVLLQKINNAFSPRYTKITFTPAPLGDEAGYRRLCENKADVIGATRLPTDAEASVCQNANIQMLRVGLGGQGVVVLVSGNNKFASCLTSEQIGKIFAAGATSKKWSDVSPDFPATDLIVLTPEDGALETDLLLSRTMDKIAPARRTDTTENADHLFRAAATQNVEGAITYMTLAQFQEVKSNVKAVEINTGKGCVAPSEATIKNSTYPLAQNMYLVLNVSSFARPEVRAYAWFLLGEDALAVLGKERLVGTDTAGFVAARDLALERFAQATAPTAVPTVAATGAATAPATAAATRAATAPAASTQVPTAAPTVAPTANR